MHKLKARYINDLVLLVSFFVTAVSGFLGREWRGIHEFAGIVMIITTFLHIVFHWKIFACQTKNFFKTEKCEVEDAETKEEPKKE